MKILFTPSARLQSLGAIAYIHRDSPAAASSFVARAARSLSRLEKSPQSGRPLPEFPDLPFREAVVPPYRFFYRARGETIWVVAAWHDGQHPDEPRA